MKIDTHFSEKERERDRFYVCMQYKKKQTMLYPITGGAIGA